LRQRQPVENITKDRGDVVKLSCTDDQTSGWIQDHLQATGDLYRYSVTIVYPVATNAAARVYVVHRLSVTDAHFDVD